MRGELKGEALIAEMLSFEAAMLNAYGYVPERYQLLAANQHPEECYTSSRDRDRFMGWVMRRDILPLKEVAGVPGNGEDLLIHCRAYEKLLANELRGWYATGLIDKITEARHRLDMLRDSIRTAETSMRGAA